MPIDEPDDRDTDQLPNRESVHASYLLASRQLALAERRMAVALDVGHDVLRRQITRGHRSQDSERQTQERQDVSVHRASPQQDAALGKFTRLK